MSTDADVKLDKELIGKIGNSLEQEWKLSEIVEIYNSLIESAELEQMLRYMLSSSSVFTLNILKHPKEEIELNNQVLHRLNRFMSLVEFISKYHKDKNDFLDKWKHIFDIIKILTSFKDVYHTSITHICVDLFPKADIHIDQERECFGSIVFIDSNSKYSFEKPEKFIGLGIINKSCTFSGSHSVPIHIFGNSLVQVIYPSNDCVDERGMFVILNKDKEENTGIGEIISFGDLTTRKANSYHLVGICPLDKIEQPNSFFLFSTSSGKSRIRYPSNDSNICFVLMISLPISDSLVDLLLPSSPFGLKQKIFFAVLTSIVNILFLQVSIINNK